MNMNIEEFLGSMLFAVTALPNRPLITQDQLCTSYTWGLSFSRDSCALDVLELNFMLSTPRIEAHNQARKHMLIIHKIKIVLRHIFRIFKLDLLSFEHLQAYLTKLSL